MFLTTPRLFTAILFAALFTMSTREIADPDFWWHLRTGQFIVETRSIPVSDIYSFTNAGKPWVTHEWLSQVLIYAIYARGGFGALILTFSTLIALTFAFVYARCDGKPYFAAFVVLLAAIATAPTWGVRPQILSLLLTSIFLFVLEFPRPQGARAARPYRLLLIPLMVLWVNLHSGFALGIALVAVYWFGELLENITARRSFPRSPAPILPRPFSLILALCLAVVPLNPNGATMYVYPFETLTSRAMQTYIQEWFSPDFHLTEFQPFALLLIAALASYALARRRAHLTDLLLLCGFAYAGLRSARHIPIFALCAAPILAANVWAWLAARGWSRSLHARAETPRGFVVVNWLILLLLLGTGAARVATVIANQSAIERAKFPAAAVDFLQREKLTAPLYNAYGWGGYLIWRRYPAARVFIDGRADVYGDQFIEEFLQTYRGGEGWRAPLATFGVRLILVEPAAPLLTPLVQDAAWQKIYADEIAVIYEKK